jgi:hypothetical protein
MVQIAHNGNLIAELIHKGAAPPSHSNRLHGAQRRYRIVVWSAMSVILVVTTAAAAAAAHFALPNGGHRPHRCDLKLPHHLVPVVFDTGRIIITGGDVGRRHLKDQVVAKERIHPPPVLLPMVTCHRTGPALPRRGGGGGVESSPCLGNVVAGGDDGTVLVGNARAHG